MYLTFLIRKYNKKKKKIKMHQKYLSNLHVNISTFVLH